MLYIRVTCHLCSRANFEVIDETDVPDILKIGCKICRTWTAMKKPVDGKIYYKEVTSGVLRPQMRISMTRIS